MKTIFAIFAFTGLLLCTQCTKEEKPVTPTQTLEQPVPQSPVPEFQPIAIFGYQVPSTIEKATFRGRGAIIVFEGKTVGLITCAHLFLKLEGEVITDRRFIYKCAPGGQKDGSITSVKTQLYSKGCVQDIYLCTVGELSEGAAIAEPIDFFGSDQRVGLSATYYTKIGKDIRFDKLNFPIPVELLGTNVQLSLIGYSIDHFGNKAIIEGKCESGDSGSLFLDKVRSDYIYVLSGSWEFPPEGAESFGLPAEKTPVILCSEAYKESVFKIFGIDMPYPK